MATAEIFQFLITLDPFFFRKLRANISFHTTAHSSDFCSKIRMDGESEGGAYSFKQMTWGRILRKPEWANTQNTEIRISVPIYTALQMANVERRGNLAFPRWTKIGTGDNLGMLLHFPDAILSLSQCHLSLGELQGYSLMYFLLRGLEWLLLANIQFIPAITSSPGQLKKRNAGVPSLETIIATIILVAFRMILVSQNSKDCGYGKLLCRKASFPT